MNISGSDLSVMFDNFKGEVYTEMDKALRRAIKRTAVELKEQTIANARAGIKSYDNHVSTPDNYEEDSILDAVRITKLQDRYDEDDIYVKVHVMGNGKPRSKTYRFRFLEKGTRNRSYTTNKGNTHNLGSIKPRRFLQSARNSVDPLPIFEAEIEKAIQKINK